MDFISLFLKNSKHDMTLSQHCRKRRSEITEYISAIRNIQSSNPRILDDLFVPCRNYVLGYKTLVAMDPKLFNTQTISKTIIEMIKSEDERFKEDEFKKWFLSFAEKIPLNDVEKFNYDSVNEKTEQKWFNTLTDLDIYYLRCFYQDLRFDQLIFRILSLNRVKKIYFGESLIYLNEWLKAPYHKNNLDCELKFFYNCSIEIEKSLSKYKLSKHELYIIHNYLDSCARDKLTEFLQKKSVLELSYVMLDLNSAYRVKLYNLLDKNVRKRVAEFTSQGTPLFKDGKVSYDFVRNIERGLDA